MRHWLHAFGQGDLENKTGSGQDKGDVEERLRGASVLYWECAVCYSVVNVCVWLCVLLACCIGSVQCATQLWMRVCVASVLYWECAVCHSVVNVCVCVASVLYWECAVCQSVVKRSRQRKWGSAILVGCACAHMAGITHHTPCPSSSIEGRSHAHSAGKTHQGSASIEGCSHAHSAGKTH